MRLNILKNNITLMEVFKNKKQLSVNYQPMLFGFISGLAVFYFLYLFQAYQIQQGVSYSGHSHFVRSVSFGLLTFVYLTIFEVLIKPKYQITNLKRTFVWYISLVFIGCQLIFLLFNYFWNWQEWNFQAYLLILREFPLLMLTPITIHVLLSQKTVEIKKNDSFIMFQSENGKDKLKIKLEDFLFANSSQNYITISYQIDNQIKEHLIRKPLKILEKELDIHHEITRSHRSFLVNKTNIKSIKDEKGKIFIEMKGKSIPVSKSYHHQFINM